jgi:hypothetical protein
VFQLKYLHPLVPSRAASFAASVVLAAGCGGGGGTASDPKAAHVTLTADRAVIQPGETVTLAWTSRNASEVETSNFGADRLSGTLAVAPTFTSDYTITVSGSGTHAATVRVAVDRPRPRFVLVGNAADPEVPQIQAILQQAGDVTVQASLPPATAYDAVVVHTSAAVGPAERAAVQAALTANKGVVLVGFAPTKLATGASTFGSGDVLDTSAVAAWFGGVTEVRKGIPWEASPYRSGVNLGFFALPADVDPKLPTYADPGGGDDKRLPVVESGRIGAAAYRTIATRNRAIGFAFRPPAGGRVAWQWHSGGFDPASQPRVSAMFRAACLWAACP